MPQVKCIVSTCSHWLSGNMCGAHTVDIWHQQKDRMARAVAETQCKSFYKGEGILGKIGSLHNASISGVVASIIPGQQVSPRVHCIVSTCTYWDNNDICKASAIEVTGGSVDESEDTNCQTFEESPAGQQASAKPRIQ